MVCKQAEHLRKKAEAAVRRLADKRDREALHDTRVALRRLRGWYQLFREQLPLKGKQRHALRHLAHLTNGARDAEICLQWLRRLHNKKPPGRLAAFTAELQESRRRQYAEVRATLPQLWKRLDRRLHHAAGRGRNRRLFGPVFGDSLLTCLAQMSRARRLASARPVPVRIHRLRIAAKRGRYLIQSVSPPGATPVLRLLKNLHDDAGAIQDLQRLLETLEETFIRWAWPTERGRLLPSFGQRAGSGRRGKAQLTPSLAAILRIGRIAASEQNRLINRFRRRYLADRRPAFLDEMERLAQRVTAP